MEETTLEDLKQETEETEESIMEDLGEIDGEPDSSEPVDGDDEEKEESPPEPWMITEGMEPVPVQTHLKVKNKLKGRLSDQKDEIAELKAEIEALKAPVQQQAPVQVKRPNRLDFDDDADFNAAYDRYLDESERERQNRFRIESSQKAQVEQTKAEVEKAVTEHYTRAAELSEKHGIAPENFQKADYSFRAAVDSVVKGQGDLIADKMIQTIGEGSEKVLYHLGVNDAARGQFISALASDPSGLKAMAFLGQKKAELTNVKNKITSNAPKPAAQQRGGGGAPTGDARKLKAAHDKALKSGTLQDVFNIRKKARAAGHDVSGW